MSFTGCATADSQWLFIALGEQGEPATTTICADNEELLAAIKKAMFFTPDGEQLSDEHAAEAQAIMETLLEDEYVSFEGDPGLHLYRVWKSREQAIADVTSSATGGAGLADSQTFSAQTLTGADKP